METDLDFKCSQMQFKFYRDALNWNWWKWQLYLIYFQIANFALRQSRKRLLDKITTVKHEIQRPVSFWQTRLYRSMTISKSWLISIDHFIVDLQISSMWKNCGKFHFLIKYALNGTLCMSFVGNCRAQRFFDSWWTVVDLGSLAKGADPTFFLHFLETLWNKTAKLLITCLSNGQDQDLFLKLFMEQPNLSFTNLPPQWRVLHF